MRLFEGERETDWESVTRISAHRSNLGGAFAVLLPNGSRLSCGRRARRRKVGGRQSRARKGTTQRLPLKRERQLQALVRRQYSADSYWNSRCATADSQFQ